MKQLSQGGRANHHGRSSEDVIMAILAQRPGLTIARQQMIGSGIYGTDIYADFYITGHPKFSNGFIIESKWQDISGSVDEKLPYLVANIRHCYPCPTIIVMHGGGFRPGVIPWLRSQIDESLIAVFRLEEFLSWCNRSL